ncbi:hypothetical protein EGR_05473 [Echinococcus granulosus]|uniref:Uncharacterized protein n=2 Tax=Echinococcus granulosus TaxID=6210 RepID=W6UFN4_ECHGR|nr:hypothetical protein EGR_05473 [Echinococcus granulosus]EUB59711.1 hypothetical protein EGR_05473 [Echinococcus granulosus]
MPVICLAGLSSNLLTFQSPLQMTLRGYLLLILILAVLIECIEACKRGQGNRVREPPKAPPAKAEEEVPSMAASSGQPEHCVELQNHFMDKEQVMLDRMKKCKLSADKPKEFDQLV